MSIGLSLVLLLLGAFCSVLFAALFQRQFETSFVRLFKQRYSSKSVRDISGLWITQYKYQVKDSNGQLNERIETQIVRFKQKRNLVYGETVDAEEHPEVFEGKITMDRYFTGQYLNILNHQNYHGAFQFVLASGKERMRGKWIGFDDYGEVNCDEWRWVQYCSAKEIDKDMIQKAKKTSRLVDLFEDKQFKQYNNWAQQQNTEKSGVSASLTRK